VDFRHHNGKRTSRQVGTLKAATKVQEQIEARLKLGEDALPKEMPSSPTLQHFWQSFEETYLPLGVRESTMQSYRQCFRIHILPEIGNLRLDEVTRDRVKQFVSTLVQKRIRVRKVEKIKNEKGKTIERKVTFIERPLSRSSIRIILAALNVLLNHALEDRHITSNPASKLGKFYKQAKNLHEEIQPLTREEVPIFLEAARVHFPDYFPLFLCAIHTGMRSGELAGLHWGDVDFNGKFLTVRRNFTRGRIEKTKTGRIRRVDLSDALLSELQQLKRKRQAEYLVRGKNEIPDYVFLSTGDIVWEDGKPVGREEGQRLEMQNVKNRFFLKTLDKARLRRIRFHDLRHTFASLLIQNGESLAYVKDQLGHSSIKMTVDVYGHLVPGANRQAVNRLPAIDSIKVLSVVASAAI
jgi:integrase